MTFQAWHVSVLIPACNEEALLPRCLRSVLAAKEVVQGIATCDVIVTVDSSTDRTREIACRMLHGLGMVLSIEEGIVGRARAIAADAALRKYRGPLDRLWLAHTDADSVVSPDWLVKQLALAEDGVAALAGTVNVDSFAEHAPVVRQRFRETYRINSDGSHPHIHGANLGIRADLYRLIGGWRDLRTAEDHDLWGRIPKTGFVCRSCSHLPVLTSGRRAGRAPSGFAGTLAAHNESTV